MPTHDTAAKRGAPEAPADAPTRPVNSQSERSLVLCLLIAAGAICLGFASGAPAFGAFGLLLAFIAVAVCVYERRKYERIGWYEHRPIEAPTLPWKFRYMTESVTFEQKGIRFSELFCRDRFFAYDEIQRVETLCRDVTLRGLQISHHDRSYYSADDPPAIIQETSAKAENTRNALAILKVRAPHANFCGPQWIGEGWAPRLGFAVELPRGGE